MPPLYRHDRLRLGAPFGYRFSAIYTGTDPNLKQRLSGQHCDAYPNGGLITLMQVGSYMGTCTAAEVIRLESLNA